MDPHNPMIRDLDALPMPDPILGGHTRRLTGRDRVLGTVAALVVLAAALVAIAFVGWLTVQALDWLWSEGATGTAAQVQAPGFSLERVMAEAGQ